MYEHHSHPVVPRRRFFVRVLLHFAAATLLLAFSLALGMWGYMHYESQGPTEAFLNASMLLGGMGPIDNPRTHDGKLFAGIYALYCGLIFLVAAGVILSPVLHRMLHTLQWTGKGSPAHHPSSPASSTPPGQTPTQVL